MDAGPSEGWAGWAAAGRPDHGCYKEKKAGENRWQRAGWWLDRGDSEAGMPV